MLVYHKHVSVIHLADSLEIAVQTWMKSAELQRKVEYVVVLLWPTSALFLHLGVVEQLHACAISAKMEANYNHTQLL